VGPGTAPGLDPAPAGGSLASVSATPSPVPEPRGLLSIFAHPDDESYGAAGLMAMAAEAGNPVWVLCVTNGDQGGRPGEMDVDHSIDPEIRCQELTCACEAMGVAEPIFLGYRDSGMEGWGAPEGSLDRADQEEAIGRVLEVMRRLRPAVIVTHDPGGVYGHPDHVKTSACTTEAFRRASADPDGPIALYHQTLPKSAVRAMQAGMEEERRMYGDPAAPTEDDLRQREAMVRLARPDEDITTIIDIGPVLDRKLAALACHESQMRGRDWRDPKVREGLRRVFGHETFVRVYPEPRPGEREDRPMTLDWMPHR
jgi:N-acetyl-1-D-myo-inositol-2-amino-2-deoxy-alpha-D-glucopyranoside deacetylase